MTKIAMRFVTTTDIPIGNALVAIRLSRSDYEDKTSGVIMTRLEEFHTDADGFLQVDLLPATHLYHVTAYDTVQDIAIHHDFIVPAVEDPNTVLLLPDLIVPPDTILSSMPYDEEAMIKIIQAKAEAMAAAARAKASADLAQGAIDSTAANAAIAEAAKIVIQAAEVAVGADAAEVRQNTVLVANYAGNALQHKNDAEAAALSSNAAKQVAIDESAIAVQAAAAAKISEDLAAESIVVSQAAVVTTTGARDQTVAARDTAVVAKNEAIDAKNTTVQKAAELASQLAAFNEIYIGKFASNPTVDGNGNPLKVGAIYENTVEGKLYQFETDLQWHPYDEESQQQMNNATLSANSAAASAGSATASMNAAEASKVAAQLAKTAAETAQTAAAASAVTATSSKDVAVSVSNTAVAARDTATQKAVDAATSAAAAALSASQAAAAQIQSDWIQTDNTKKDFIKNKPVLAAVATTGAKADIGLGSVDNTSDVNKPVSAAVQTALSSKINATEVAVYPVANSIPRANPNGYMNPAWIDPNLPIHSNVPLSVGVYDTTKYGYSFVHGGQGQTLYKIATLRKFSDAGTHSSLRIDGVIGGWNGASLTNIKITLGSRGTGNISADWSVDRLVPADVSFVAYAEEDGSFSLYLFFLTGSFAQAHFNVLGGNCTTYASPTGVGSVTGELAFYTADVPGSQTYIAPRMQGVAGKRPGAQATMFYDAVFVGQSGGVGNSYISAPVGSSVDPEEMLRLGVAGYPGYAYPGYFGFLTSPGSVLYTRGYKLDLMAWDSGSGNWTPSLFSVKGDGTVYMPLLKAGSSDPATMHHISRGTGQGAEILMVGVDNAPAPSVGVLAADGAGGWGPSLSVLYVGKNSVTGRAVSTPGTVNTSGNDYAEYIFKCPMCEIVAAGQIIGINADNKVTDKWADAVMFSIKSTAPSFVGGDAWASGVGQRPSPQAGPAPIQPLRREDVVTEPGDTDSEWAEKQAAYTAALAAHNIAVQQDAEAMTIFDAKLEVARARVDRIAIAGRVPVNVQGAQPGDYIVPVQDGEGIKGIAVHEDALSMKQYLRAVGHVISIEPDGRAYVMVKVV